MMGQLNKPVQSRTLCIHEHGLASCRKSVIFRHQLFCKRDITSRAERVKAEAKSNGHYEPTETHSSKGPEQRSTQVLGLLTKLNEMKSLLARSSSSYEERLWDRQDVMWEREMRRWDAERALWTIKEQKLQQQISALQALVIKLALDARPGIAAVQAPPSIGQSIASIAAADQQAADAPSPTQAYSQSMTAPPVSESPAGPSTSASGQLQAYAAPLSGTQQRTQAPEDLAANLMEPSLNAAEASRPQPEGSARTPATPGDTVFDLAEFQALYDRKAEEAGGSVDFAADLANAIAAVDLTDVMQDDNPFRSVEKQGLRDSSIDLGAQERQQSTEIASASGPVPALGNHAVLCEQGAQPRVAPSAPVLVPGCDDIYWMNDWPILREGEGGKLVHHLQVVLNQHGYYCGEDETVWWQFGMDTYSSLLTFQACNGLPETGVADVGTWRKLMPGSGPSDILGLVGNDETDDDMQASDGKIWLLGEQRWAKIG